MNKEGIEEIEEIKKLLFQDKLTQYGKRKLVQYLEQKESILDKVTEECRKQMTTYEDSILEIFPGKLLNIIEGEKK